MRSVKWMAGLALAMMVVLGMAEPAMAQLTPPSDTAIDAALGSSTDGSETGLYELRETIVLGLSILLGIVMLFAGYRLVRMFINRGSAGR